jgi:hypothetical protein
VAIVEIRVAKLDVRVEAMDEQVHPAQPVREVLAVLADERKLVTVLREEIRLHEHAARSAAGVEDDALLGFERRDQRLDDGDGREVLAAALPLARRELADEVLVDDKGLRASRSRSARPTVFSTIFSSSEYSGDATLAW